MDGRRGRILATWLLGALVFTAVLAVFSPGLDAGFVSWDDGIYIYDNAGIRALAPANLRWMATNSVGGMWQPATLLSLAVDYRLWHLDPWGYHFTNIVLHGLAALLFYLAALKLLPAASRKLDGDKAVWAAALAALFFAVHPLRVESVVWATERKDVLAGVFFFGALLLRLGGFELAALAALALLLSAKVVGVVFPVVLTVLEIYPQRRLPADPRRWAEPKARRALARLAPYYVLAACGFFLALSAGLESEVFRGLAKQGPLFRLSQFLYGLWFYPLKTLWPSGLAAYYPPAAWFGGWSWRLVGLAAASLAAGALCAAAPAAAALAGAYAAAYLPMSGLVQVGIPFAACDRYSYFPCLGFALLFGWLFARGRAGRALALAWLAALGAVSYGRCAVWKDSLTFWTAGMEDRPSGFAQSNLGIALIEAGREAEGLAALRRAVSDYPDEPLGYDNLGVALSRRGREAEARELWSRGLAVGRSAELHEHLGYSLSSSADPAELAAAISHLRAAITLNRMQPAWRLALADALVRAGRADEALAEYGAAVRGDPWLGQARNNRGLLLERLGRSAEALADFRVALRDPATRAEANYNWGNVSLAQGRVEDAERHYREALRLRPGFPEAAVNLGNILANRRRFADAEKLYLAALKKNPGLREARVNLAAVRRLLGR